MEFIDNLKKLGEKENKLYLILLVYLIIGYTIFRIFILINLALIGAIIYFPILGFTSFFWFLSLLNRKITEYSTAKIILLLIIDCILMILLLFVIVIIIIISVFSYIFFTSLFLLYGCFKMSKEIDERLYYKHGAWFWRGLEFWGGLAISLLFIYLAFVGTFEAISMTDAPEIISIAYIAMIIVIICLAIYGLIHSFGRKFNGWLGSYFLLVTIYTVYLVLKVFLGLTGGGGESSSLSTIILLLILDLFILVYSISSIIGKQGKYAAEKFKRFKQETLILWLIFSKAAWEFALNFPYGALGIVQAFGITYYSEIGSIVNTVSNIGVLIIFLILVVIFGYSGIQSYGEEKKRLKGGKIEVWLAKKSGEREDHVRPKSDNIKVEESEIVELDEPDKKFEE
jgi:hypothetical protein